MSKVRKFFDNKRQVMYGGGYGGGYTGEKSLRGHPDLVLLWNSEIGQNRKSSFGGGFPLFGLIRPLLGLAGRGVASSVGRGIAKHAIRSAGSKGLSRAIKSVGSKAISTDGFKPAAKLATKGITKGKVIQNINKIAPNIVKAAKSKTGKKVLKEIGKTATSAGLDMITGVLAGEAPKQSALKQIRNYSNIAKNKFAQKYALKMLGKVGMKAGMNASQAAMATSLATPIFNSIFGENNNQVTQQSTSTASKNTPAKNTSAKKTTTKKRTYKTKMNNRDIMHAKRHNTRAKRKYPRKGPTRAQIRAQLGPDYLRARRRERRDIFDGSWY